MAKGKVTETRDESSCVPTPMTEGKWIQGGNTLFLANDDNRVTKNIQFWNPHRMSDMQKSPQRNQFRFGVSACSHLQSKLKIMGLIQVKTEPDPTRAIGSNSIKEAIGKYKNRTRSNISRFFDLYTSKLIQL